MLRAVLSLFLTLMALPAPAIAEPRCMGEVACAIGARTYHLREPDGWDGETPLRVLMHFHGWGRQGDLIVGHNRIARHTRLRGVLLVAPNGLGRTWDFRRAMSADVIFADAVLDDVMARYPVDEAEIYVSGYSYGAIMAQRYGCDRGERVRAVLSIAGTLPPDTECASAPAEVRHVHGLNDQVLAFRFGPDGGQTGPVADWLATMGCDAPAPAYHWQAVDWLRLTRHSWACARGHVTLDVHPGGHFIPHGWIGWQLDQLARRAERYP